MTPATGRAPVGAGPGDAGKSSVQAGFGGAVDPLPGFGGGTGSSFGGEDAGPALNSAVAIARPGLAKSLLDCVDCNVDCNGD